MNIIQAVIFIVIAFILGIFLGMYIVDKANKKINKNRLIKWAKTSKRYRDEQIRIIKETNKLNKEVIEDTVSKMAKLIINACDKTKDI